MSPLQRRLLCTVAIPVALGFGVAAVVVPGTGPVAQAQATNPCSPCGAANPCSPCGATPAGSATDCVVPRLQQAQANPCAAKNPCAAVNPCNPCAVKKPCEAAANPCATEAPCGANPCAAKNPCNPCAAENPCKGAANPCAGNGSFASFAVSLSPDRVAEIREGLREIGFDPGATEGKIEREAVLSFQRQQGLEADGLIGRQTLAALEGELGKRNPCNPCAAKSPCSASANPCAAKNPCAAANPCAAKNPCGAAANPCNPCNPCAAAAEAPDVTPEELRAVYKCLHGYMRTAYGDDWRDGTDFARGSTPRLVRVAYSDSGLEESKSFLDWKNFATSPYTSATHGNRFVVNHANDVAEEPYGKYEDIGSMPEGGIIAKPSFTISANGEAQLGPLFLMEKMSSGWDSESRDWRYTMVMPDGTVSGRTQGRNAEAVAFCVGCHATVADAQDSLFFIPEEVRVR